MGKVDEGGGGTVAYLLSNLNMHVLDICLPTLSLHSPFELISKVDYHYTVSTYKAFMENSY
jgi:aspartyl aminopeptidase